MKKLLELLLVLLFSVGLVVGQDQCANCKCTEYPVPAGCEKCCGVIKGRVAASSGTQVKVTTADGESRELRITKNETVVRGKFDEGDQVTVVYRKSTKVAGLILGR
jgi:hypothetical protein